MELITASLMKEYWIMFPNDCQKPVTMQTGFFNIQSDCARMYEIPHPLNYNSTFLNIHNWENTLQLLISQALYTLWLAK